MKSTGDTDDKEDTFNQLCCFLERERKSNLVQYFFTEDRE